MEESSCSPINPPHVAHRERAQTICSILPPYDLVPGTVQDAKYARTDLKRYVDREHNGAGQRRVQRARLHDGAY